MTYINKTTEIKKSSNGERRGSHKYRCVLYYLYELYCVLVPLAIRLSLLVCYIELVLLRKEVEHNWGNILFAID